MPVGNIQETLSKLQQNLKADLGTVHGGDRNSRRIDLDYMNKTFDDMSKNHESKAKPVGNIQETLSKLQQNLKGDLRKVHGGDRNSRRIDLDYMNKTFDDMSKNHESKAWKHSINFIGGVLGIVGAALGKENQTGLVLSAIGQTTTQVGNWTLTFNDVEMSQLQGHMEQLRDMIQQDNKDDSQVQQLILEIDRIMNQALERMATANKSPFHVQ